MKNDDIPDMAEATKIYLLPNLFTSGNLFFGFLAIIRCIQAKYVAVDEVLSKKYYAHAVWCIIIAAICDVLDGRLARLGGKETLFGKEFDSLADLVSFGVAPALMVFFLILSPTEGYPFFRQIGWFVGFVYLLCAAVRLARFNVLTHPLLARKDKPATHHFSGLPSPIAAGNIVSIVMIFSETGGIGHPWALFLPLLMLLIAWLMVSHITYPSIKHIDWKTETKVRGFVLCATLIVLAFLVNEYVFPLIFLGYTFYGIVLHFRRKTIACEEEM